MMPFRDRLGFDRSRLPFALRTAFASWAALALATAFHLESPHWAAMTVWLVAQPTRGLLLEKSLYRLLGTLAGAVAGVGLIVAADGDPQRLLAGLALWVAACAGVGNVVRHFRGYGVLLAGYTAAMIVLLDTPHPDHAPGLALGRVASVMTGIVVSAAVSWLFIPSARESDLMDRLRRVAVGAVRWSAGAVSGRAGAALAGPERLILADMAAVEEMLDLHGSGSAEGHRRARHARGLIVALLALMAASRTVGGRVDRGEASAAAGHDRLAGALNRMADTPGAASLTAFPTIGGPLPDAAAEVVAALEAVFRDRAALAVAGRSRLEVRFHRDWVGARAAALRAMVAVLAVGGLWLATGWTAGPFMVMGTAIMVSLFSGFDDPVQVLRSVLLGSIAGAGAAVVCRLLLLPLATDTTGVLLLVIPFLAVGGVAMASRRTQMPALDYTMTFLLLAQPVLPLRGTAADTLNAAAAALLGVVAAMLAYRFVLPVDAPRRLRALVRAVVDELEALASARTAPNRQRWRARLYHRVLRLIKRVDAVGGTAGLAAVDGGIAAFSIGDAILCARRIHDRDDLPAGVRRRLWLAVRRLQSLSVRPDAAAAALERAAAGLCRLDGGDAGGRFRPDMETLRDGAQALRANRVFFDGAGLR